MRFEEQENVFPLGLNPEIIPIRGPIPGTVVNILHLDCSTSAWSGEKDN